MDIFDNSPLGAQPLGLHSLLRWPAAHPRSDLLKLARYPDDGDFLGWARDKLNANGHPIAVDGHRPW